MREADRIIRETYEGIDLPRSYREAAKPTINLLKKHGVTHHPAVSDALEAAGLMSASGDKERVA
jgi:hypothetical protein